MVYKDEVCMWFKNNESHRRLELLCGLLNMCLPFELRFIRTCVEDLGKRDDLLRDLDSKANNSSEISQLGKVLDERTRSKFVVYVALLEANNQTCSKILFEILSNAKPIPNSALTSNISDNTNYIKEMLLIYTMVLNHPAFTFEEKRIIGERLQDLQIVEEQIGLTSSKEPWSLRANYESTSQDLDSCHPISNSQILEACDSGLSIGTEPEGEILSDHACVHSGNQLPKLSGNSSCDNKFPDVNSADRPMLNPSIGIKATDNRLSNVNDVSAASVISENSSVKSQKPCAVNRDASSSGSGESLDLYGENLTVPTTYIYNSNICENPNLSEVSAVALNSNLINFTPGYMYQHNGRCHFYHYPSIMGGVLPSMPLPRKLSPLGVSSETSSSEEGATPQTNVKLKDGLRSSLSSSHSSPYVSPPQSLTPSRASSPKETVTTVASSHISLGLVTCTTTTIVISRSNERPSVRHNNNGSNNSSFSGSGTSNSQPSSPALSSNSQVTRNKPHMLAKCRKYSSDRSYDHIPTLDNLPVENCIWNSNDNPNLYIQKENISDSKFYNSKETLVNSNTQCNSNIKYSEKSLENIHKGIPTNMKLTKDINDKIIVEGNGKTIVSNAATFPSSVSFKTSPSVLPNVNTLVSKSMDRGIPSCGHTSPVKMKIKNSREEELIKENSVKGKYDGYDNINPKVNSEKDKAFKSLPNGFNEQLIISSAHSVPLKHSIVNTSSVPSCSCTHISVSTGNQFIDKGKNTPDTTVQKTQSSLVHCSENKHTDANSLEKENKSLENIPNSVHSSVMQNVSSQSCSLASKNYPSFSHVDVSGSHSRGSPSLEKLGSNSIKTSQQNASLSNVSLPYVASSTSSSAEKHLQPINEGVSNPNSNLPLNRSQADIVPQAMSSVSLSSSTQVGNCCKSGGPIYTTTTSSTNCPIVSLVPSPSTYPPYISIPMLPGGGPSTLLSQGAYHIQGHQRNPSHTLFLTSPSGIIQGNPGHVIKNPTHIPPSGPHSIGNKSRGGSSGRSGSSSSSSSGGLNRKKGMVRGNVYQNKSRSSDSSPSSSQYSSPPQTPSPDHTKDNRPKTGGHVPGKPSENFAVEDMWDPSDHNGSYLPLTGAREEETPPPHAMGAHVMIPSNPVRQRYFPYHHPLGFIGYHPHSPHGMYRYSLASPVMIGPRPTTPLSSEKSSRETTPPNQNHNVMGPPEMQQKVPEYPNTASSCVPTSSSYNMCAVVSASSIGPSSASPPIPTAGAENSNITLVPPPPSQSAHSGPTNGGLSSNIPHYNSPNYPMFAMGASPFMTPLSGFMQSSTGIPNGYVSPHNLPHNYPVPSIPSGLNSGELVYPNPYPMLPQSTLATSSCGGHPSIHQSSGGHGPVISPSPTLPPPYSPSYQGNPVPPTPSNPVPPPVKKTLTCYNCGKVGHRGSECREASIDEMTKRTKVL